MTMLDNSFVLLLTFLMLFNGCADKQVEPPASLDGVYQGTFTVEYSDGQVLSNSVTVDIMANEYSSSSGSGRIPAGGSGTFEIRGDSIQFSDQNMWTADFDWNLILNGTYKYSSNGKELVLSADKNQVGTYRYQLRKE